MYYYIKQKAPKLIYEGNQLIYNGRHGGGHCPIVPHCPGKVDRGGDHVNVMCDAHLCKGLEWHMAIIVGHNIGIPFKTMKDCNFGAK